MKSFSLICLYNLLIFLSFLFLLKYLNWNSLKLLFFFGTINIPETKVANAIIIPQIMKGFKYLL